MEKVTQEIKDLIKAHDSTFEYSDDPYFYRRGRDQKSAIIQKLEEQGMTYTEALNTYKRLNGW